VHSVKWSDQICSGDNMMVTFSKCCGNEPYCSASTNELDCEEDEKGLYCHWVEPDDSESKGKCVPKPDDRSDVCCRGGTIKDACHSIAYKMECPQDWLVSKGCCPDDSERKYNEILGGIPDGMDCCNSPCTQVEKAISSGAANCTLNTRCAPGPRSYAMTYDPYNTLGFFHSNRHHGSPHSFGSIYHGSGYGHDYGHDYYEDEDYEHEKDDKHDKDKHGKDDYDHVDEITVDDLFELMIEALEEENDVKSYEAEYYTDSYLGKTKSGGLLADFSLPDPDYYLDLLYGNPWGIPYNFEHEFVNPRPLYDNPYPYGYSYNQHVLRPYGYKHDNFHTPYGAFGGSLSPGYTKPYPQL